MPVWRLFQHDQIDFHNAVEVQQVELASSPQSAVQRFLRNEIVRLE